MLINFSSSSCLLDDTMDVCIFIFMILSDRCNTNLHDAYIHTSIHFLIQCFIKLKKHLVYYIEGKILSENMNGW